MALRRDFHLSDAALAHFLAHPVGSTEGAGGYHRRRHGTRARIEGTIEVERAAGRLHTTEDVAAFLYGFARMLLQLPPRNPAEDAEEASHHAEHQSLHRARGIAG